MGFGLARTARSVFLGRERPPEVRSVPIPLRILAFVSNVTIFLIRYFGGDDGIRTHDPLLAGQVLSQLSYTPVMGNLISIYARETVFRFLLRMSALDYLPVQLPVKYFRHCRA